MYMYIFDYLFMVTHMCGLCFETKVEMWKPCYCLWILNINVRTNYLETYNSRSRQAVYFRECDKINHEDYNRYYENNTLCTVKNVDVINFKREDFVIYVGNLYNWTHKFKVTILQPSWSEINGKQFHNRLLCVSLSGSKAFVKRSKAIVS